ARWCSSSLRRERGRRSSATPRPGPVRMLASRSPGAATFGTGRSAGASGTAAPAADLVRPPRRLVAAILAIALTPFTATAGAGATIELSLARYTDSATATKTITTDTLTPPTALAATGGTSVALTWTATADTYATGYEIHRAAAAGGPYSLVTTVTPRTTVAATDGPGAA